MQGNPCASDPRLLAVEALDQFVAQIVRQARQTGVPVPALFFDWVTGDATRMVERLVALRLRSPASGSAELGMALRCAVRHWTAPWIVARFAALRPLFPELTVRTEGAQVSVLVRTGRWRCRGTCAWRLCEAGD